MASCHLCFLYLLMMLVVIFCNPYGAHSDPSVHAEDNSQSAITMESEHTNSNNRKLLLQGSCSKKDISIAQSQISTSGIPHYRVEIANTCLSGCDPSDIHVHCGSFSSTTLVNPTIFRRLSYDDCLVNGGKPLQANQIISFTYATTFKYPLAFKSAKFC